MNENYQRPPRGGLSEWLDLPRQIKMLREDIKRLGWKVERMEEKVANELQTLTAQVAKNADVEESAIRLLQNIKAALDAAIASGDPKQLQALSDTLGAEDDKLAAAVVANTPAA